MRTLSFLVASLPAVAFAHPGPTHVHADGTLLFLGALGAVVALMHWASRRWTI